jgi:hypothetical protein
MKKIYFLFLFFAMNSFSQHITITKIIETDCSGPYVKTVELYVDGTVDFSSEVVMNYMNNGAAWSENQIDLSGLGSITDSFVYIVRDIGLMQAEFPSTTFDASNTLVTSSSTNGDDGYQIVLNGLVVSQFGKTETDADDDTIWEHDDSVVSRISGVADTGAWDETQWEYSGKNSLDGNTACKGGAGVEAYLDDLAGTYPLGSGSGWTPTSATCTTALGDASVSCNTTTAGAADDTYTASLDFSGGANGKTFVLTTSAGTLGGDAPTSMVSGTITVSNIPEGTAITITVSDVADGGVCSLSKQIDSPGCIPLIINEVLFDPAGDIAGDANGDGIRDSADDEFIEFVNNSDASLDISGYTLLDGSALRHTFSASTVIPANSILLVFGGGTPTGDFGDSMVQTASEGQLSFNNSGDIATIKNTSGVVVLEYQSSSTGINHGTNQSVTRDPDITGSFVEHSTVTAASGALFSPGTLVDGTTLSSNSYELTNIGLYPNPVSQERNFMTLSSSSTKEMNVVIYTVLGKQLKKQMVRNNQVDISGLKKGIYLLKISQEKRETTRKILIK